MKLGFTEIRETSTIAGSFSAGAFVGSSALGTSFSPSHVYEFEEKVISQSGLPLRFHEKTPAPAATTTTRQFHLRMKRVLDFLGALAALIVLGPLLVVVAIAVKLTSPGPVFFKQAREGINGTLFSAYKFRSMRNDLCDLSGVAQTQFNDVRITPVGRFIRKTSIDELPQLFNVLRGEMSLVGPRPHVPRMLAGGMLYTDLVSYYHMRLAMPPGITGWAQANGFRGMTGDARSAQARIDHDVAYIQNYSLWLDIKTIFLTVRNEFITGSGH